MSIKLYNTMSRTQEEFKSIEDGKVSMYCCGPTVYNYAHIGNLRTYIFEDLLHRTLEHAGYKVDHVMNITDVGHLTGDGDDGEDKISKRAKETGKASGTSPASTPMRSSAMRSISTSPVPERYARLPITSRT